MLRKIGIDVGGVIMTSHNKSEDTSFFGANYLQSEAEEGAFEGIKTLVDAFGAENVFIVSKCGLNTQRKTMEWFTYQDFYNKTGFREENIYFCKKRHEKAPICETLGITDFVDDRLEVLSYMNSIDNVYLFNPQLEEMNQFSETCGHYTVVWNWEELMAVFRTEWHRYFRGYLDVPEGAEFSDINIKVTDAVDMYDACIPEEKRDFAADAKAVEALYAVGYLSEDQKKFTENMLLHPIRHSVKEITRDEALRYSDEILRKAAEEAEEKKNREKE